MREITTSLRKEGNDLLRGGAGGLIFGTPLLYTMEMWQHGMIFAPVHLLSLIIFILNVNLLFSYASGMRAMHEDHSFIGAVADTITALVLGMIIAALILYLIGQLDDGIDDVLGKIIIEGCAISIGVTFTNYKFPRKEQDKRTEREDPFDSSDLNNFQKQNRADLINLAAIIGGAIVFSFNIAPTEEIILLASDLASYQLLILLVTEFLVCYLILFSSGFKDHKVYQQSLLQTPMAEVSLTVGMSLLMAAILLAFIGHGTAFSSLGVFLSCVIVLGFPAVIGGAAGRIVA